MRASNALSAASGMMSPISTACWCCAGGAGGSSWVFDYNPNVPSDDETGYRLGSHRFVPGNMSR